MSSSDSNGLQQYLNKQIDTIYGYFNSRNNQNSSIVRVNEKVLKKAWRCDLHSTFDSKHNWIVYNGRPEGKGRQIMMSYIGNIIN